MIDNDIDERITLTGTLHPIVRCSLFKNIIFPSFLSFDIDQALNFISRIISLRPLSYQINPCALLETYGNLSIVAS